MRIALLILSASLGLQGFKKTYTDERHGFSVPIPNGWTVTAPTEAAPRLVMRAPARDRSGGTLILDVTDPQPAVNDGDVTLDRFLEEVKKQYPTRFEDFTWVDSEIGTLGKHRKLLLYYTYSSSGQTVGQLQMLVWTKEHHYSLSWGCLASRFKQNRKLFERASKAFKTAEKE